MSKRIGSTASFTKEPTPLPRRTFEQRCPISCFTDSRSPTSLFISCSLFLFDARFQVNNSVKTTQFSLCNPAQGSATTCNDKKLSSRSLPVFFSLCYQWFIIIFAASSLSAMSLAKLGKVWSLPENGSNFLSYFLEEIGFKICIVREKKHNPLREST